MEISEMNFSDRLKALRVRSGMTQKELGERLNVSLTTIGHWENGTKKPSMDSIVALASIFNVPADFILGISGGGAVNGELLDAQEKSLVKSFRELDTHGKRAVEAVCRIEKNRVESELCRARAALKTAKTRRSPTRYIPKYYTPSAAGYSTPLDGDDFEMILVDENVPDDADFAVIISGSSMSPYIEDGDVVYVRKDSELQIGDVGIFCVDGAMYCKQYYIDSAGALTLLSANPRLRQTNVYVSTDAGSEVRCFGKVILESTVPLPDYLET